LFEVSQGTSWLLLFASQPTWRIFELTTLIVDIITFFITMTSMSQLPFEQSLLVATPNTIHHYSQRASQLLFECEATDRIVNAQPSKDNSSLLAVADNHIVILIDASRSKDRQYKLQSGAPRLLLFSPDLRTLYFTTTLSTSVQAYDIPSAELLPPQQPHPSPPNVLAVSSDANVLLSASPAPPTIYLQDRRWSGSACVRFQLTDTHTPVSCAAFQMFDGCSYTNFVLGFQNGQLAVYRLYVPDASSARPSHLQPVRIGAIQKLHKAAMGGITAAAFIPGYKSRVVSIGLDGRCRLVDFADGAQVLRT
jgi:WD40 repeat protein